MAKTTFTYEDWTNTVIGIVNEEIEITDDIRAAVIEKAEAFRATLETKKNQTSKRKPKGASAATKERAAAIVAVLTTEYQTSAEIAAKMGVDITPLQISNALQYAEAKIESGKVVRTVTNSKGLTAQREYTAYRLA